MAEIWIGMFKGWLFTTGMYCIATVIWSAGLYLKTSWDFMRKSQNVQYDIKGDANIHIANFSGDIKSTKSKTSED